MGFRNVEKVVSIDARDRVCHEIPWLKEAINRPILLEEDKLTHAKAQADISLHSSPSSATYRVKTLAPRENPRPSNGARG
jgi:hypothetical protein